MAATGWLIRRRFRRRWLALVSVGLITMLGATGALVAAGAADRTSNAYSRYLERANVGDVAVNPSLSSTDIDEAIRGLPGVRAVTRDALFVASLGDARPQPLQDALSAGADIQIRGSIDGRYTAMDRPAIEEGRSLTGTDEALVSAELADAEDIAVGDVIPVSFWRPADELLLDPETVVTPLAVEELTVVGIATLPDEVLPDGVYPRQRVIVSPDVAERYDCLPEVPPRDVTLEEAVGALLPDGCATSYPYYSLSVDGGSRGVSAALAALIDAAADLSAQLPQSVLDDNAFYSPIATTTAQEERRVDQSIRPTVAALGVLAAAAAAVTVIVLGLVVARELRRTEDELRQWWHLGMSTPERALVVLTPLLAAVVVGLVVAVLAAWLLSPAAPVGLVRSIDPSPDPELSTWAQFGVIALFVTVAAVVLALAFRAARRSRPVPLRHSDVRLMGRLVRGSARPELDEGLRAAFGQRRGTGLVVASGALAAGLFLAATVFSTSLFSALSTPASYGWPWDVGLMGGSGYGEVDLEAAAAELDERGDVERWTGLGFTSSVTVDGRPTLAVVGLDEASDVDVTVVEGDLPVGATEVAFGSRTADDLGVGVGDEVELGGEGIAADRATVTGIVVLPALGPILADRTGPGTGMLLPASALEADQAAIALSFIGVDPAPGADTQRLIADIQDEFPSWDPFGEAALEFPAPVRPPEIINAESMQAVPVLVGVLLMATAGVGLVVAVIVSVRSRQRELAVLRALGFTGRQLRDSVRVQTVATMVGALVIGVPLGIVIGRLVWRLFAEELGIVTDPSMPVLRIAAVVVGALVVAVVAAEVPARLAGRTQPASALHSE